MNSKFLAAAASVALALTAGAAQANVKVFQLNEYVGSALGSTGSLGTITVEDFTGSSNALLTSAHQLLFTATLNDGYYFMTSTGSKALDMISFDLSGNPALTASSYTFVTPVAGNAGGGNVFTGAAYSDNAYGRGFAKTFDYAVQAKDSSAPPSLYAPTVKFLVNTGTTGPNLSVASLLGHTVNADGVGPDSTIYLHAEISKGVGLGLTGPVGATYTPPLVIVPPTSTPGVPEPASWALMIAGFGGAGAALRRRRQAFAAG